MPLFGSQVMGVAMTATRDFAPAGYRFIPGVFPYSAGIAALPGHRIERVRFQRPVPLAAGFAQIRSMLAAAGRPLTAFCACELRSPAPFTEAGFRAFNKVYVGTLAEWGLFENEVNPVARSNVCPELDPPPEPSFHAFAFTVPAADAPPSFVVAGSGEVPEGHKDYFDHIVARGDVGPNGLREKARFVLGEIERRLSALGFAWHDTTATQVYTVHDLSPLLAEIVRRGAARAGLTWHFARPPVVELEFEMDCRGVRQERVV
jgi:hypothetical protein